MLIIFLICGVVYNSEISKDDLKQLNFISMIDWKPYIPTQAFAEAISSQGCVLPREPVPIYNASLIPTRVLTQVDTNNQVITSQIGKTYSDFGTILIANNLLQFEVDFNLIYQDSNGKDQTVYGTFSTQPISINYSVWVRQNNKTIGYTLSECPNMTMDLTITQLTLPNITEREKMQLLNEMNSEQLLSQTINQYYEDHQEAFCNKLKLFVTEQSIPSKINFNMFEFYQYGNENPLIVEAIENILFQGLNFNQQLYVLGINVEIFNYQTEYSQPLDVNQLQQKSYCFGISMDLLKSYFDYGAQNGMFDMILTNSNFPIEGFNYKTSDLRTMIPSAYYSFKLDTDIIANCVLTSHVFLGLLDQAVVNNTISVEISHRCNVLAQEVAISQFDVAVKLNIAVREFSEYIDFFIKQFELLHLQFTQVGDYNIWSLKNLEKLVITGLETNLIQKNVYGSGWLKNQLGVQISYGFTQQTLSIWNAQLI